MVARSRCVKEHVVLLSTQENDFEIDSNFANIFLPAVLRACETWSLTSREERRLRVSEKRVLGRIFGPKWDEVTGE
jgi:hypothetical protein